MELKEKTKEEIANIAKEVVNLLAEKKCTVNDAETVFRLAKNKICIETNVPIVK